MIYLHTFKDSAFDSSPLHVHVTALTFTRPACHPVLNSTEKHGNMGMRVITANHIMHNMLHMHYWHGNYLEPK